ncbi:sensor histidine kinase [Actinoplanes auranticolor]|uniref:histidine kinase n=1 Tax=Actinoplanes auranticolor TaxID=47988 RepID=A0A919VFX3_9ACTN|nr:histidine kinase [Actinoplanes auranticolor]GIM62867.1 two-component sensor histidine kinase [Actinoplanes auranticolor]
MAALCFHVFGNWSYAAHLAHPRDVIACTLLLAGPLALAWRGRAPVAVVAVAGAASIGYAALAPPSWTYAVAPVIALFTAVRTGHRRSALITAAAGYLVYLAVLIVFADPLGLPATARPTPRDAVLTGLGLALTAFIASAAGARAAYLAELSKANAERARAKAEQERRQAADERLRIARELHDVLGHHLSLINVQAGVGLHLMDNRPEQAREALSAIKTASAEALREVRAVLGVLRPEEEAAPRQPALGLDRLTDLTADAGLPVTTETVGERRDLPAEVDRAAYRIVQEALTNVRRHAEAGASATVSVTYAPGELRLEIRNDGARPPIRPEADRAGGINRAGGIDGAGGTDRAGGNDWAGETDRTVQGDRATPGGRAAEGGETGVADDGGSGIAGMRARAASLGGSLQAGPLPDGGYLVSAVLPTRTTPTREPA